MAANIQNTSQSSGRRNLSAPTICTYCEHPQAKPEPWETVYITGSVTSISCAACTIEGRGTLGCPIHIHYCSVHRAAPELLNALKQLNIIIQAGGDFQLGHKGRHSTLRESLAKLIAKAEATQEAAQ